MNALSQAAQRAAPARRAVGLALLGVVLLLSACGFHLRGSDNGAPLPPTAVAGDAALALQADLKRLLRAGAASAEEAAAARWVIRIVNETSEQRVLSVGSSGKVEEYELYYAASFVFEDRDGQPLGPPQSVAQTRSYSFSESAVLGKDAEQETLLKDMRRDVASQILRRLRALGQAP